MEYQTIRNEVEWRKACIKQKALEDELYNEEWLALTEIENQLIKLSKIRKEQEDASRNNEGDEA